MYKKIINLAKNKFFALLTFGLVTTLISSVLLEYLFVEAQQVPQSAIATTQDTPPLCSGGYQWCFEGGTVPGESQSPSMMWDNPIDDQWKKQDFRQKVYLMLNETQGSSTIDYVHIDRTVLDGPSWIMIKDPQMNYSSGFEAVLSVRIPNNADKGSVAFIAITEKNHFAIIFENNRLIFNPVGNQRYAERKYISYPLDLSNQFSTISISQDPGSSKVNVSLIKPDGTRLGIFNNVASTLQTREAGFRTQLSFGDNQDDYKDATGTIVKVRGVYDLDFIRIKKLLNNGNEYPLPAQTSVSTQDPRFFNMLNSTSTSGNLKFGQIITGYNPGYNDDLSVAWKMSLSALNTEKSHLSLFLKGLSYTFEFSKNNVLFKTYGKPVGSAPVQLSSFVGDQREVCFRFVHKANSPYADLYVNNNTQPIIVNAKGSAAGWATTSSAFVLFGKEMVPSSIQEAWSMNGDLLGLGAYKGSTTFSFIKFAQGAYLPQADDAECYSAETLGLSTSPNQVTSATPGQTSVKTAQINLDSSMMRHDVYFSSLDAEYVDNTNLDFKNCIVYQGSVRLNGTAVNAIGSGVKSFVLDKKLFIPKGTTTNLTISCTIPQGIPNTGAFAGWNSINLPSQSDLLIKNQFTPTTIYIKK